jgi:hypothetical protein
MTTRVTVSVDAYAHNEVIVNQSNGAAPITLQPGANIDLFIYDSNRLAVTQVPFIKTEPAAPATEPNADAPADAPADDSAPASDPAPVSDAPTSDAPDETKPVTE